MGEFFFVPKMQFEPLDGVFVDKQNKIVKRCEQMLVALETQVMWLQRCLDEDCEHIVVDEEDMPQYRMLLRQIEEVKKELYAARMMKRRVSS